MTNAEKWALTGLALAVLTVVLGPPIAYYAMNTRARLLADAPSADARRIHRSMRVVDLHSDLLLWDSAPETASNTPNDRSVPGPAVQVLSAVNSIPTDIGLDAVGLLAAVQLWPAATWFSPLERVLHQAARLDGRTRRGEARLLRFAEDVETLLAAGSETTQGVLLSLEGGDVLEGDLQNLDVLFEAGFRLLGLVHLAGNPIGGAVHDTTDRGLTAFGHQVVERADELGMILDLAHASPALVDDVLAVTDGSVIVSHTGIDATCDSRRNIDSGRARRIAGAGGVIGIGLWDDAVCGSSLDAWARTVAAAIDLVGVDAVALGSDWHGAVEVLVGPSQIDLLVDALLAEGLTPREIRRVMSENALAFFRRELPESPRPTSDRPVVDGISAS